MRRVLRLIGIVPLLCILCQTGLFAQAAHVDKKNGYQVKPPQGWGEIPLKVEEKWIIGKWQSDKKYEGKEAGIPPHVPLMRVILFEKANKENATGGAKPVEVKQGDTIEVGLNAPYLDYKDYLKRNFSDGGFFVSAEEEAKINDSPVTMIEVKVEKLAYTGKKRIMAWIFHAEYGDIAIEVDSLEDKFDKLKPLYIAAFRSFKVIPRDASLAGGEDVSNGSKIKITDGKEETPEEMKKRRMDAQEKVFKKAVDTLPQGWTNKRTAHYLILNHAKPAYADKVAAHAEAVRDWLDKDFGDVGEGYVQNEIIRICKDSDEERAFRKSSGDAYSSENREAVVSADSDVGKEYEMKYLGQALLQQYFSDKNAMLYRGLPPWLESGLSQYVGTAVLKGRALAFEPDQHEMERMREGRRANKFIPVKELFSVTAQDMWQGENGMYVSYECASIVRYLYGPGAKQKKTGHIIRDYIAHLLDVIVEEDKKAKEDSKKASSGGAKTEEEEEAEFKKRRSENWDKKQKDLLTNVFGQTFDGWSDADWTTLQKAWEIATK